MADKLNGHLVLGYRWYEPDQIFRRKFIYAAHFQSYDFEGNNLNNGFMIFNFFQFVNYYSIRLQASYNFEEYSKTLTRGGPLSKNPEEYYIGLDFSSDRRKSIVFGFDLGYQENALNENWYNFKPFIEWKPNSQISLTLGPEFSKNFTTRQWVDSFEDIYASSTFNRRYVFGNIDQKTVAANIRLNWTITPKISLQLFMQPLMSVGTYSNFKELAEPSTMNFNNYNEIGSISYNSEDEQYSIDPDKNGAAESFSFDNPNFNFKSLRGTMVFRWEILPGSIFYLVWSQDRTNFDNPGEFKFGRDLDNLLSEETNDIFLAKFSYWLDI
jgi:hypothetical protein